MKSIAFKPTSERNAEPFFNISFFSGTCRHTGSPAAQALPHVGDVPLLEPGLARSHITASRHSDEELRR